MRTNSLTLALTAFMLTVLSAVPPVARAQAGTGDASQIFEEAFIYGFPMVMNYGVFYQYFVDKSSPEYKAPFNILYNSAHVYTPKDTAVVTPNSDTPYSFVAMDLRAEPFVICNPEIEKSRYFSVQLVDFYTFNYGYMGSRTTGNSAECNMVAGPRWKGEKPAGVANVFHSETDFSFAIIRTQLFNAADLDNVKKIQDGYRAGTLSQFEHKPAPPAAAKIKWPMIDKKVAAANFFGYLDFLLRFCPPTGPAAVEVPLRARFASVGIQAGVGVHAGVGDHVGVGVHAGLGDLEDHAARQDLDVVGLRAVRRRIGQAEHGVDREPAQLRDLTGRAQRLQARHRRLDEVDRVLGAEALGEDVVDPGQFQHGAHPTAGDDSGTGRGRFEEHPAGAEDPRRLVGDRGAVLGHPVEVLLGALDALLDRYGNLVGLPVADPDDVTLIAHHDQRGEGEAPSALDDLGDAVDLHHALLKVQSGC